jgi:hypothetical protein
MSTAARCSCNGSLWGPLQPPRPLTPHRVPNICLGAVGVRTKVRLLFPKLYDPDLKVMELTHEQKKGIYEIGILPVIRDLSPDTVTNWPVNYEGANTRATKANGRYQYSTRPFPGNRVRRFGYDLAQRLAAAFPWAHGMLFMTQVQGVKEANQHSPDNPYRAADALTKALSDLVADEVLKEDHCYVDVGLELGEEGYSYQWRLDSHHDLLTEFTNLTHSQATNKIASRDYIKDYSSGLMHLAGCRIPLGSGHGQRPGPVYLQAYTTDKALIQQRDGARHGMALSGKAALREITPSYMDNMYRLYFDAKDHHDCAVRLELRLPIKVAATQALDFPEWLMRDSLCVFTRLDWW